MQIESFCKKLSLHVYSSEMFKTFTSTEENCKVRKKTNRFLNTVNSVYYSRYNYYRYKTSITQKAK